MPFGPNFGPNFNVTTPFVKFSTCREFINLDPDGYKPLACKPITVQSEDDIGGHLLENAYKFFFLAKRDTIREHATLDVLYPTPNFIVNHRNSRKG